MATGKSNAKEYQCSFCGKTQKQVKRLVAGPGKVFICDECVKLCQRVVEEDKPAPKAAPSTPPKKLPIPKAINQKLDEYVVGQEMAKRVLSVAVYNHYKRIWSGSTSEVELQKSNILLVGPTGCGKTLLAQTLARILDVPFAISDATSLTESGYVGEDVENILLRLIQASDWDVARAERGIVYIDELDKIARKEGANRSITRDVSGEGVQQELLKIIEGCIASVPPQGGRKHPYQEAINIKTNDILFICGGAFDGLEQAIVKRLSKGRSSLGFRPVVGPSGEVPDPLHHMTSDDLLDYGLIPELVGRLPVVVALQPLDKEGLVRVLTEPRNSIVRQYQRLFSMDNVELIFTPEALEVAADEALHRKAGARGLRAIIERTLLDVMYELPSQQEVARCVIDADVVRGLKPPFLLNAQGAMIQSLGELPKSA